MKIKWLVLFALMFIALSGYYFLHNIPLQSNELLQSENSLEEYAAQQRKEFQMLADPSTGAIPQGARWKELAFLKNMQDEVPSTFSRTRAAEWTNRGPWNVGGRTRAMAIDVNNENHLIAGGVSGGLWQSFNAGQTWQRVSDPNGHPGIVSITQDVRPGRTHIWYALSGEIYGTSASGGGGDAFYLGDGAFKSLDNGSTWTAIASTAGASPNNFTSNFQGGWRIISSPVDTPNTCIYMATYGTIYRSTDTGKTWKAVLGNGNNSYFTDVQISKSGVVYAAMSTGGSNTKGIYRSANGINFTKIMPSFLKSADRMVIEINPNNENEVYFLGELPSDTSGGVVTANYENRKEYVCLLKYKYLSGDGSGSGGEWMNLSDNLPVISVNPFDRFNSQGGYDLMLKMQPGSNTLIIGGTNLYRSTDAFSTKLNISQIGGYGIGTVLPFFTVYPNHHPDQHNFYFLKSNPNKAYSVCDGGIFFCDNIMSPIVEWQSKNTGYLTTQLYTVTIDQHTAFSPWLVAGLQDNGNYISATSDPKHHWFLPVNGDGAYNYIAKGNKFYVMSTQLGRIVKVELDNHGHILARRRIDPDEYKKENYAFINPFIIDPNDENIMYLPIGKRIARLNNLTQIAVNNDMNQLKRTWFVLSDTIRTGKIAPDTNSAEISAVAVSKSEPNILYIGTSNKEIYRVENAHTGDPKFILLDTITKRLPAGGYVSSIAVDPDSAKNVLVCYSNYNISSLFFSNDYGKNWFWVGGNLELGSKNPTGADPSIRSVNILVDKTGKRHYFAGTSIGLFSTDQLILSISMASSSNKTVWVQESPDKIGAAVVTDVKTRNLDGYVAIATHGNGAYESYFTGEMQPSTQTYFPEITAYPNPASHQITFSFDSKLSSSTNVEVYDINGKRVASFSDGINYNGAITKVLDVSSYPSGHYFISFYTSKRSKQTKHFIVHH